MFYLFSSLNNGLYNYNYIVYNNKLLNDDSIINNNIKLLYYYVFYTAIGIKGRLPITIDEMTNNV